MAVRWDTKNESPIKQQQKLVKRNEAEPESVSIDNVEDDFKWPMDDNIDVSETSLVVDQKVNNNLSEEDSPEIKISNNPKRGYRITPHIPHFAGVFCLF